MREVGNYAGDKPAPNSLGARQAGEFQSLLFFMSGKTGNVAPTNRHINYRHQPVLMHAVCELAGPYRDGPAPTAGA
jgi:hypothetical protein